MMARIISHLTPSLAVVSAGVFWYSFDYGPLVHVVMLSSEVSLSQIRNPGLRPLPMP